jgi:drug/metabolite transporter (DMT)-like permease
VAFVGWQLHRRRRRFQDYFRYKGSAISVVLFAASEIYRKITALFHQRTSHRRIYFRMGQTLSTIGLLMAGATSVSNVVKDIAAKKVVDHHELIASTFWIRLFAAIVFVLALVGRAFLGSVPGFRDDGGELFGIDGLVLGALPTYLIYLLIEVLMVACSTLLYFRAIQVTPISLCMPYISFTPVFLIVTGQVMLGEMPATEKLVGVLMIFLGSIAMHRTLFSQGLLAPIKAVWQERGCFYMLLVGFINSITNPIDKKLVTMTDAFTQACAFGAGMAIFFTVLLLARKADAGTVIRSVPMWAALAGTLEAVALIFQLSSHNYIDVVITISLKRAGIILVVLLGWLVFKEKNIGDKIIASSVMLVGVLIIYLPVTLLQGWLIALVATIGMFIAFYLTRNRAEAEAAAPYVRSEME